MSFTSISKTTILKNSYEQPFLLKFYFFSNNFIEIFNLQVKFSQCRQISSIVFNYSFLNTGFKWRQICSSDKVAFFFCFGICKFTSNSFEIHCQFLSRLLQFFLKSCPLSDLLKCLLLEFVSENVAHLSIHFICFRSELICLKKKQNL